MSEARRLYTIPGAVQCEGCGYLMRTEKATVTQGMATCCTEGCKYFNQDVTFDLPVIEGTAMPGATG